MGILPVLIAVIVGSPDLRIPPTTLPSPISAVQPLPVPPISDLIAPNLPQVASEPLNEGSIASSTFLGLISVARASEPDIKCLCVAFARTQGLNLPYPINADQLKPNAPADIGNGILFRYGDVSHIAVITGITEKGWKVIEANKVPCQISERVVEWADKFIIGFYK